MTDPAQPVVCLKGVHFAYDSQTVLEDADFDIHAGESVCMVGPNGGGKSTLIKLMLGLIKPDQGEVLLFGDSPLRSRNRVGYVPQQVAFDPLFPISALEVCLMGSMRGSSLGWAGKTERTKASAMLESMELGNLAEAPFSSLSGGQRQAVLVARALLAQPDLLLLDEPTAHVDVASAARLMDRIHALGEDMTVLMVSHDLSFVARTVPKVVCVNRCVHVHPTRALSSDVLNKLYGHELRMVQHDHEHLDSHGGHCHG
ncbi:MAG: High-affinity zinc uptake system ATP-binding protein ZnuC [Opitutia bacterium UBA7350]|nr:MAG: High-affinity zinc uptake system ATP-binding protein ZnuC [Opitutae bacterium UBA7350]